MPRLPRPNLILVLATIFGLAAAWGVYQYTEHLKRTYKADQTFVPVVVAKTNILARTVIKENMVEIREFPANYAAPNALGVLNDVVGKIARVDLAAGEQITKNKVVKENDASQGLAFVLEPGKRATTIAVNEVSGVAGLLKPGDRVDVVGTIDITGTNQTVTASTLLLQNIQVLAVNQSLSGEGDKKKPVNTQTVTLAVTPAEAQQLILAAEKGSVRLLLRSPGDQGIVNLPSTTLNQLVH